MLKIFSNLVPHFPNLTNLLFIIHLLRFTTTYFTNTHTNTYTQNTHTLVAVVVQSLSYVQLFQTPWTVAHQDPLSIGFPRQEYWRVQPFPSSGDLPDSGTEPESLALQVDFKILSHLGRPKHFPACIYNLSIQSVSSLGVEYRLLFAYPYSTYQDALNTRDQ